MVQNTFTATRYAHPDRSLMDCTDSLGNHSVTVAQDLESSCVSKEKAVFRMAAEEGIVCL